MKGQSCEECERSYGPHYRGKCVHGNEPKRKNMDIDTNRVRDLLDKRDAIDTELASLVTGTKDKKPIKCGNCGDEGHSARTCTKPKP